MGAGGRRPGPLEAIRGVAVMLAAPILLGLALGAALRRLRRARRRGPAGALLGVALLWALVGRRRLLDWGATAVERTQPLPGDELVPAPALQTTRAVTIDAPPGDVWPWLAQIGQDRGGFYSYERLENLAGARIRNADRIHPEWQRREVGELVMLHPANGLRVARFEPGRVLVLEGWGAFVVEPAGPGRTRLLVRGRVPRRASAIALALLIELPHLIMERRMLLGIKERAERGPTTQLPRPGG